MKLLNFLFVCFLLCSISIAAAQKEEDDIIDLLAQETCDCIGSKELNSADPGTIEFELGMCILGALSKNEAAYKGKMEINMNDPESMHTIGEKIGARMAFKCPKVLMLMTKTVEEETLKPAVAKELKGLVIGVEEKEFSHLVLREQDGSEHRLMWLRYFEGSDALVGNLRAVIGKKVQVTYESIDCYSPQAKEYFPRKEIRSLKIIE